MCIIIVGVVVLASAQTFTRFVTVRWIFQYYTQKVSTILGVPQGKYGPRGESLDNCLFYWRHKLFFIFFSSFHILPSFRLLLRLALCEGHMYCLWPLPCLLLVCTTLVRVLFVATTTYTISVYCLWPLPRILLGCTTLECVLFVHILLECVLL